MTFDEFWSVYPKRKGSNPKVLARTKWDKAIKNGAKAEDILHGAKIYRNDMEELKKIDTEFVCMAATWLNQQRWTDYVPDAEKPAPEERARIEIGSAQWQRWREFRISTGQPTKFMDYYASQPGNKIWMEDTEWPPDC